MSGIAPVAFFAFNRPGPTARVFEEIRRASPSILLLVADGPRADHPSDIKRCLEVRDIMLNVDWPCSVRTNFSDTNLGCKERVASGINWVFEQCEECIILEDDCLPTASFFTFCSELLTRYRFDTRVMHISGSNFQAGQKRGDCSYFFSQHAYIWGWATWRRAWSFYDQSIERWPYCRDNALLRHVFHDDIQLDYWTSTLQNVYDGQIDTWDYQWQFVCWVQNGAVAQPNTNLVTNIGYGPEATHTTQPSAMLMIESKELPQINHPQELISDRDADVFSFYTYFEGFYIRRSQRLTFKLHVFAVRLKRILANALQLPRAERNVRAREV